MFEEYQICPYTGLRSFTEEESLYFKGREEHIEQATEQLQRNKFLMLTGASGDGKSSLVYAGIIPNARAGFLKSKYTQWCVADFRPERSPFSNLCKSVARQLDITNQRIVESELQHGFSALVDLYKNSKRYVDTDSVVWQQADEKGKAALKREAANLIILVDQFEEFFTNPENYNRGVPSKDSNLVLNLLLETSRIALEENLPIYIVFTMRSDYIGQCAAFRGLPEYIGFSQFFVPRLNRSQLQQVIEEPATLSGNTISRRLTERLIHDITEGVDQLPILQHALNQIWHAASNGKEEMDLIHYAMVGGMPVHELPEEQVDRFNSWFDSLPPEIKACYREPDLQNVLDTHTNKLYEQAAVYYSKKTGKVIFDSDAKAIIKAAFICLTKIDQSRAVRNRMTLKEITNILGRPEFSTHEVGAVLNIFREPGNTFIRPFITDETETLILKDDDILDITHESLIRNWEFLGEWATEEFNNYTISLDFEQQLNRWVDSGNSNGFLLSIGPLTYFENWFTKAKPNAYWVARYLPEEFDQEKKLLKAKQVLGNAEEFLRRSARKHVVTRTVMRYGPKRIAAVLGLIAILTLSSFAVRNYFRKQNDYVLKTIKEQSLQLVNVPRLSLEFPVPVITQQLIAGTLTIPETIEAISEVPQKIRIATGIATHLIMQGRQEPAVEILQSLTIADSLLQGLNKTGTPQQQAEALKLLYDYSASIGLARNFNPDKNIENLVKSNAARSSQWAMHIIKTQPKGFTDIQLLSAALDNGINYKVFNEEELNFLLAALSPFENNTVTPWMKENYARDKVLIRGTQTYGIRYNGLFQDLAYLYAAAGKPERVLQCMDSVLRYEENFYQNDYATHAENAANVAAVFYTYGKEKDLPVFVNGYCARKKVTAADFYHRLVAWMFVDWDITGYTNFYAAGGGQVYGNLNLKFASDDMLKFFYARWKEEINTIKDSDERNFSMAVALKNEGNMLFYRKEIRKEEIKPSDYDYYKNAFDYFQKVSATYLDQPEKVVGSSGSDMITPPRKYMFIFPDYRVPFHPFEPRSIIQFYNSGSFIQYLIDQNLFDDIYKTDVDRSYFESWLLDYQIMMSSRDWFAHEPLPYPLMQQLAEKLEESPGNVSLDINILYLHLSEYAFLNGEHEKGIDYLKKVKLNLLLNAFQYKNFDFVNSYSLELTAIAMANLAEHGQFDLAYNFAQVFKKEVNRSSLYAHASQLVSLRAQSPPVARRLLDSAQAEMNRLQNISDFQPNRHNVAIALMYINPGEKAGEAYRTIKNSFNKFQAIWRFSYAYGTTGNLYEAQQQMPLLISTGDQANFLTFSMKGYNQQKGIPEKWKKYMSNELIFARRFLPYIAE
jgi:energy-coupling factor transporter ATP-binding protein EcfA2